MVKVSWTARYRRDLEEISEYIAKDFVDYARLTLEKLIDTANLIERNKWLSLLAKHC
jgi:plasmid stabilization system protein ParE